MKTVVAILLGVAMSVGAQLTPECQGAADQMMSCISNIKKPREGREERKAAKAACFVDSGCENPFVKKECLKKVVEGTIVPILEQCARMEFPDFIKRKIARKVCGGGGRRGGRRGRMERKLEEFCPDEDTRADARECLEGLDDGSRPDRRAKWAAIKDCFAGAGECGTAIWEEKKRMKAEICNCAKGELADNEQVLEEVGACLDEDDSEEAEDVVEKMVDKFCRKRGGWGKKWRRRD